MKKLLTVLLTLVMAVCLVNLDGNHIKAEENPSGIEYRISWNGSQWTWSKTLPDTFNAGDSIIIENPNSLSFNYLRNGTLYNVKTTETQAQWVINNTGATVILTPNEDKYKVVITDVGPNDAIPCTGVLISSSGLKSGNTTITPTQLKNTFGITYTAATGTTPAKISLSRSLKLSDKADATAFVLGIDERASDFVIELEKNISIENSADIGAASTLYLVGSPNTETIKLDGKGHTLSLVSHHQYNLNLLQGNLDLSNIKIDAISSYPQATFAIMSGGHIKFDDKSELQAKITSAGGYAMASLYDPTFVGDYEILGTADGVKNDLKVATRSTVQNYEYKVDVGATPTNAKYVVMRPKLEKNPCTTGCNIVAEKDKDVTAYIENKNYDTVEDTATVKLNGNGLTRGNQFELSPGSVYVTMKKEYLSSLAAGTYDFVATLGGTDYHIHVTISGSTPSPSEPVVKDESCEKVIGPTWHWNNTKGICEDYGVVGTSTR